jgi:hypothetical protein
MPDRSGRYHSRLENSQENEVSALSMACKPGIEESLCAFEHTISMAKGNQQEIIAIRTVHRKHSNSQKWCNSIESRLLSTTL